MTATFWDLRNFVGFAFEGELNHSERNLVEVGFGQNAVLYRFDYDFVVCAVVAGHFEVKTRFDAFDTVVYRAPVADDDAFETPFVTEYVGEHAFVVGKVSAGKSVVRAHDGRRLFGLYDVLERGQIDFAERALVDYAVNAHAEIFLIVCAEVFE